MNVTFPKDYCVYDLETTGLDTATCRIVEMAVKRVVGTEVMERSWLVKPETPLSDEELRVCRDITGIDPQLLEKEGRPMKEVLIEFLEAAKGLPLVGHNIIRYDNAIMRREITAWMVDLSEVVIPKTHAAHWFLGAMERSGMVDTAALYKARKMSAGPAWHENHEQFARRVLEMRVPGLKFNLVHACTELGIDVTGVVAHRASGDVEMVDRLYRKMCCEPQ